MWSWRTSPNLQKSLTAVSGLGNQTYFATYVDCRWPVSFTHGPLDLNRTAIHVYLSARPGWLSCPIQFLRNILPFPAKQDQDFCQLVHFESRRIFVTILREVSSDSRYLFPEHPFFCFLENRVKPLCGFWLQKNGKIAILFRIQGPFCCDVKRAPCLIIGDTQVTIASIVVWALSTSANSDPWEREGQGWVTNFNIVTGNKTGNSKN